MFCPECGTENPDDASFCGSCGKAITVSNTDQPTEPDEISKVVDLDHAPETVPDGLKYGVLAASVLMPLIGVGMGIYYMMKGENEDKKSVGRLWLYAGIGIAVVYFLLAEGGGY